MKRLSAILLAAAMLFVLTACGNLEVLDSDDPNAPVDITDATEPFGTTADDEALLETEANPIDYGDGDIPDNTASFDPSADEFAPDPESVNVPEPADNIPAPRGYYASESGEYAMFFAPNTTADSAGYLSLEHNGEVSAWGDYRTEEVVYNGEANYYIWLTVKDLDEPIDDIHVANYYPDDDILLQLESLTASDGELMEIYMPVDVDFAVILYKVS